MKRINSTRIFSIMIMIFASILPVVAMAQGGPGEGADAPLDGGVSLLLAAGVGYGVKKYRNARSKQKTKLEKDL